MPRCHHKVEMNSSKFFTIAIRWLVILIAAGLAGWFWLNHIFLPQQLEVQNKITQTIEFEIAAGESIASIGSRLERLGVIADDWVFTTFLKKTQLDREIEAGYFQFVGGETVAAVAEILRKSSAKQIKFTVLEGWNSAEIDAALVEGGFIEPNEFALFVREGGSAAGNQPTDFVAARPVVSLEGYLFPATYFLDVSNFSIEDLVARMLTTMQRNLTTAGFDFENPDENSRSLHEILTLASIVELETRSAENRPLVADILWRRLDDGTGLYADATLFYVLGHRDNLTAADLALESPYNTRQNRGLPPTPIASPGLASLRAALHPTANNFYYYLHDAENGAIHFAETLAGHNANKIEFLQ